MSRSLSVIAVLFALTFSLTPVHAQVKPGDTDHRQERGAGPRAGESRHVYRGLQGHGDEYRRAEPRHWPPPYQDATEKYSSQVRLAPDHRDLIGFVAGQPFPLLDPNDPDVATKIMWNQYFKPIATDDYDLRFFECQVAKQNPGAQQALMTLTEVGHLAAYSDIGRTEVEPLPADPDFKITGIWGALRRIPLSHRPKIAAAVRSAIATGMREAAATTRGHSWRGRGACAA